ncbi:Inherit from COG: ProFAR isomerase [Seminavis robusta]|uniref:Inherit from COG: ProFAR isomerase n=1 Tax=Seminavis robusta TaxID=568900 RepID=A0A9N8ECB2_9STRA|nr:Inherit from COG: ProFAR isomerase [Seminavis robusta]|eukprot:Sro964_g225420.1 Inherit from COG: ProFAR isomerase (348) ;mRNA; f:9931-10974
MLTTVIHTGTLRRHTFVDPLRLLWWRYCHGFCFCCPSWWSSSPSLPLIEQWEFAVHQVLANNSPLSLGISEQLHDCLLVVPSVETTTCTNNNEKVLKKKKEKKEEEPMKEFPIRGLPCPPYYKTLGRRLCALHSLQHNNIKQDQSLLISPPEYFAVPAEALGFTELMAPTMDSLPTMADTVVYPTVSSVKTWIQNAGDVGIVRLLGMRQTVGTTTKPWVFLMPPCRKDALLKAANQPHKATKLTVAGRARSKHAHRGTKDQFFGIATGSKETKNIHAAAIVERILDKAVWINLHVFGGIVDPVLECRLENGYGARWAVVMVEEESAVEFRGFVEPQMPDGHEKGWKH